ncbi:xyloglucan-specific endo-beta-1 [Phytophthora nicotianae]|nr:xyloglucan-specific endo-beta-1 [Phytophthora nicotianae]
MHQQLQVKTEETEALAADNKELRALVTGYKKALEEAERNQRDIEAKHLAEIENLRAVHSLELSDLQARYRQKLEEVTMQNDEKLLSRRRQNNCIRHAHALSSNTLRTSMSTKTLQGDPRRPGDLHPFVREQVDPDDAPGDWYAFFSLVLGFLAFTMKWKELAWGSLLLCFGSFTNMKSQDMNTTQVAMSFFFSTSALVSAYMGTMRPGMLMPSGQTVEAPAS